MAKLVPRNSNLLNQLCQNENKKRLTPKPLIEKRRRARINNCLNQLKSMIIDDNPDFEVRDLIVKAWVDNQIRQKLKIDY